MDIEVFMMGGRGVGDSWGWRSNAPEVDGPKNLKLFNHFGASMRVPMSSALLQGSDSIWSEKSFLSLLVQACSTSVLCVCVCVCVCVT